MPKILTSMENEKNFMSLCIRECEECNTPTNDN